MNRYFDPYLKRIVPVLLLPAALFFAAGCGTMTSYATHADAAAPPRAAMSTLPPRAVLPADEDSPEARPVPVVAEGAEGVVRMIVYNGRLTLSNPKPDEGVAKAREIAKAFGGYEQRVTTAEVVLRIPVARFQEAVEAITGLGDVVEKVIEGTDVTEEYFDVKTRLENKLAALERLKKLYENATVEEALKIEQHLDRIREEVERLKGRLELLQNLTSLSTLTVQFVTPRVEPPPRVPTGLPIPWLHELGLASLLVGAQP